MSWKNWLRRSMKCSLRKWWVVGLGLALFALTSQVTAENAPVIPPPLGYVNDFARLLDEQTIQQLTELSKSLEQATGVEMVFVLAPSIAPYDDFTYGMAIFDQWKIGKKSKDNGLLVLLAMQEHRIRIMPGYGLESILPDGKLGRYRDQYLIPYLKQQRVGAGLVVLGIAMAQELARAYGVKLTGIAEKRVTAARSSENTTVAVLMVLLTLLLFVVVLPVLMVFLIRKYGVKSGPFSGTGISGGFFRSGGGGFGGGFSGFGGGFSGGGGVGGSW